MNNRDNLNSNGIANNNQNYHYDFDNINSLPDDSLEDLIRDEGNDINSSNQYLNYQNYSNSNINTIISDNQENLRS